MKVSSIGKLSILSAVIVLSACGGGGSGNGDSATSVNVSSPTNNVIHTDVNQDNQKAFTVSIGNSNLGAVGEQNSYPVTITQSNPAAGFSVDLGSCANALNNGQSCRFNLHFQPTAETQYNQLDTLTVAVAGQTQTFTIKGEKGQDFVVFGDSLSDTGVQDKFAALVEGLHAFLPGQIPEWSKIPGTQDNKAPTYTTPGGKVWVTDLARLVGQSDASASTNNTSYIQPIKVAYPVWYTTINQLLGLFHLTIDTESASLSGNNYAQGGATTTCAGIGFILPKTIFPAETGLTPPGNLPLYIPSPIGPIPQINGQPAYSCPKAESPNENLQPVYDQSEKDNQIDSYLNQHDGDADPEKVYILWGGANNLFIQIQKIPTPSAAEIAKAMAQAAGDIAYDVAYLAAHGAKKFVVLFLPNIGLTPLAISLNQQAALEKATVAYNAALNNLLGTLQQTEPTIKILPIDVFNLMNDMVANFGMSALGENYQFDDVTSPACIQQSSTGNPLQALLSSALLCIPQSDNKKHIFEDSVHPTALTHEVIARKIAKAMEVFG